MLMHFGMTGSLAYFKNPDDSPLRRLLFAFENGLHLAFDDARMSARWTSSRAPRLCAGGKETSGPDPLSLTPFSSGTASEEREETSRRRS